MAKLTIESVMTDINRLSIKMRLLKMHYAKENIILEFNDRQVLILELLSDQRQMNLIELCNILKDAGQSTISADLKMFRVDKKLVEIIVGQDGRVHLFTLTKEGQDRVKEIRNQRLKCYASVAETLPNDPEKLKIVRDIITDALGVIDRKLKFE